MTITEESRTKISEAIALFIKSKAMRDAAEASYSALSAEEKELYDDFARQCSSLFIG